MYNMNNNSNLLLLISSLKLNTINGTGIFSILNNLLPLLLLLPHIIEIIPQVFASIRYVLEFLESKMEKDKVEILYHTYDVTIKTNGSNSNNNNESINKKQTSPEFNYILFYMQKNMDKLNNGIKEYEEIKNTFVDNLFIEKNNYLLLPFGRTKGILLCKENNIYCKIYKYKDQYMHMYLYININDSKNNQEINSAYNKLNIFIDKCKMFYEMENNKNLDKRWIYELNYFHNVSKVLTPKYSHYELNNNKILDYNNKGNVYFEDSDKLIKYIDKFIYNKDNHYNNITNEHEEYYKKLGVTYKAGMLFYGHPGCGKTSTIKAILNRTNRNGVIINLSNISTNEELEMCFRNTFINNIQYSYKQLCFIIEDCDTALNELLLSRDKKTETKSSSSSTKKSNVDNYCDVDLATLLNILDGVIELNGAMIIFTTNHPEKLDPAFTRPGRIDFKLEFKKATVNIIYYFINNKYNIKKSQFPFDKFKDYILTPADVQSICFKNNDYDECIAELLLEQSKKEKDLTSETNDNNQKDKDEDEDEENKTVIVNNASSDEKETTMDDSSDESSSGYNKRIKKLRRRRINSSNRRNKIK